MTAPKSKQSELVSAARALDAELREFDTAATALVRAPMDTQKHLERVARLLGEIGTGEERLQGRLSALVQAITVAREQREHRLEQVRQRALDVERRAAEFASLLQCYGALGERAAQMNERVSGTSETDDEGTMATMVAGIDLELAELAAEAGVLAAGAREASFSDLVKLAETMRQELTATRGRLRKIPKGTVH